MAPPRDNDVFPRPDALDLDLGLRFLQARRAQNLSWMRLLEHSLRGVADIQRASGPAGASLARVTAAHAGFVRDSAEVYALTTTHLAR